MQNLREGIGLVKSEILKKFYNFYKFQKEGKKKEKKERQRKGGREGKGMKMGYL